MNTVFIYSLVDPRTEKCRYVGKTRFSPEIRFNQHLQKADKKSTYKNFWIRELRAAGLVPTLEVLDEVPENEWPFWEQEYIRVFRFIGFRLTNLSEGGEGSGIGRKFSEESRKKMSLSRTGMKHSEESRRKRRLAGLERVHSPETKEKIRLHHETYGHPWEGRKHSSETRKKMRQAWALRRAGE